MRQKLLSRDPSEVSIGQQGLAAVHRSRDKSSARDSPDVSQWPGTPLPLDHSRRPSRPFKSGSEISICPSPSCGSNSGDSNRSDTGSSTISHVSSRTSFNSSSNALLAREALTKVMTGHWSPPRLTPYWPRVILNLTDIKDDLPSYPPKPQQPLPYHVRLPPLGETIGADRYRCYKNQPKSSKMKYILERMGSTADVCAMLNPDGEVRGFTGVTYHDLLRMKYTKEIQAMCKKPNVEILPEGTRIVRGFQVPDRAELIQKVLYPHRLGDHTSSCRNLDIVHDHYLANETATPPDLLSSPPLFSPSPSPPKYFPKRGRPTRRPKQIEVTLPAPKAPTRRARWKDEVEEYTPRVSGSKDIGKEIVNMTKHACSVAVSWQTLKE